MGYHKNNILNSYILHVVFFICLIKNGFGLHCYVCDSTLNETCSDINTNINSIKPQKCDLANLSNMKTWLAELNNIDFDPSTKQKLDTPMICQKVVATKNNEKATYRSCQLDSQGNKNPCELLKQHIKNKPEIQIISCDLCGDDDCNSAIQRQIFTTLIYFSTALSIILTKIFQ